MTSLVLFACALLLLGQRFVVEGQITKGVVYLDTLTFDKVIGARPYVLVKIDKSYPSGPKEDAFKEFAERVAQQKDLLVTAVAVSSYGDNRNEDVAARFNLTADDYPHYRLIGGGQLSTAAVFDGEVTTDNLVAFIRRESGLYIGLPGCLEEFDRIAAAAIQVSSGNAQMYVIEAQKQLDELTDEKEKASANVYIKILQLLGSRGERFPPNEVARVTKLLNGKLTPEKKKELQLRLNILQSFLPAEKPEKEEL